jgi:glutamyl-tRNA synthetase
LLVKEAKDFVKAIQAQIEGFTDAWNASNLHDLIHGYIEQNDLKMGKTMPALRLAVTGLGGGPDLMGIMEVIGKAETLNRLEKALNNL